MQELNKMIHKNSHIGSEFEKMKKKKREKFTFILIDKAQVRNRSIKSNSQ